MDVKIIDVARAAGVSTATVSRVLNGSPGVTPKTRSRVESAVRELGYHPNAVAKNLRVQKTKTIAVIVQDINVSYFTEIVKGIENMAYVKHYKVLICDSENQAAKELEYLNLLMNRTVDAAILVSPLVGDEQLAEIAERGYSIAVIGRHIGHEQIPCIYTDNVKFSLEVVRHLAEMGHRDIAFLSGFADSIDSYERLEGYMKALKEQRLPFRPELIDSGGFSESGGYEAMGRLLDRSGGSVTAVYAANDEMALGVYKCCRERGLRIPEDIAVVGVDNNRISKYISPSLSTVNQPKYTMGALLVEKLIDSMNEDQFGDKRVFKVDSELLVRGSSSFRREG
ncbi:LacI family DNA-binding transcriptional regulator [Paenibacillus pasadenensis]|uniref:Catabolite control protein A n=1 Tax=Paenibacillus pasadenensis TaxID=217090 RepID=A0A2N5N260_9BACL|nr:MULTISPECIES: LacI family DNA-binding transcriptional regulator [Paenibacillus]PLT44406.1 Catabolite control protein A [Paenibacillus pasadenensis]QGG54892.1 LacI family DNA-binding transcriptional regulator [Paenibacillus sp. B01]